MLRFLFLGWAFFLAQTPTTPCQWIKENIENYFQQFPNISESQFCTPKYVAYKNDAMSVDMDGGMTARAFHKKWGKQFNSKKAGLSVGFFVSGNDFGKVEVTSCQLLKTQSNGTWWKVVIRDQDYQVDFHRDIFIVTENNQFKIADVREYP